jgi:outer membrane protein
MKTIDSISGLMRKKWLMAIGLSFIICYLSITPAKAQDSTRVFRIGYLSYDKALQAMPDYSMAQQKLAELKAQYEAELKRAEADFNAKYEEFLEGQREFPRSILLKRQTELQELMARNVAFRDQSRRELADAETAAVTPLKERLTALLADIARRKGYVMIVNTDANAYPFIDVAIGEDINQLVQDALR